MVDNGFDRSRITVIPNGVDTNIFSPATVNEKIELRKILGLPVEGKIAVFSGRFEEGKGIEVLLTVWPRLQADLKGENITLVLLGSGSLEEEFKKQFGCNDSIRFEGWKTNTADYLRAGDIFILPSFGEGLPNSLLEAMSCGMTCIATKIGGISEIIQDGENGLLIEAGNAEMTLSILKEAVLRNKEYLRLGLNARAYIEKNMSIGKVADLYLELYSKLI